MNSSGIETKSGMDNKSGVHTNSDEYLDIEELLTEPLCGESGRSWYRLAVETNANYAVVINNEHYPLLDVSNGGGRISIDPNASLGKTGPIPACRLILDGRELNELTAEVVHYSLDDDGNWICGIRWQDIAPETQKQLDEILLNLRKELFTDE